MIENLNQNELSSMEAEIETRRNEAKPTYEHYSSTEHLSGSEISNMEAEIKARREEIKPITEHYGSVEHLSDREISNMEAEIKARREEVKPITEHYGSVEHLSGSEISNMEAEIQARRNETKPVYEHYGSAEHLSDREISNMEAEIKARREEVKPITEHYGAAEHLSDNEIASMEAEIRARRAEVRHVEQNYGSVENMNDSDISVLEAQVAEKRKADIPYRQYFSNLLVNPLINDKEQFENSVIQSMQSNEIMRDFVSNLVGEISKYTNYFKQIDKKDVVQIEATKKRIEDLINVYVQYLYQLKKHDWNFYGVGTNIGVDIITDDMLNELWSIQKNYDVIFNMPIPKDLGEYYGGQFERQGKAVPGIRLMYDDIKGKEVNWHQVLNYKENELTPKQRFWQRQIERYEQERSNDIKRTINNAHVKEEQKVENENIEKEQNSISSMGL